MPSTILIVLLISVLVGEASAAAERSAAAKKAAATRKRNASQ
jgi:hypothetical protein